ncbi:MAG: squalene/phytoene synthase family protein [Caulobacteraceae bacterium]
MPGRRSASPDRGLDSAVRRADPDRWLSSRLIADPAARADVVALYAFDHELARAQGVASNALVAEMRLVWWRETLDGIFGEGVVRRHPGAESLATAIRGRGLRREPFEAMIDARVARLDQPVLDLTEALGWADDVGGSVCRLAADILDPDASSAAMTPAGRLWGLTVLLRQGGVPREALAGIMPPLIEEASRAAARVSADAFPALAHVALARPEWSGAHSSPLEKRVRLLWAAARGRI